MQKKTIAKRMKFKLSATTWIQTMKIINEFEFALNISIIYVLVPEWTNVDGGWKFVKM